MSHAVRHQARIHGNSLQEGDVLLSNHPGELIFIGEQTFELTELLPAAGGSHLPDLTVIMPAFHEGKIIFWTAARAVSACHAYVLRGFSLTLNSIMRILAV
jgi:5-oxoprolinase (ATP-hydrolysing)